MKKTYLCGRKELGGALMSTKPLELKLTDEEVTAIYNQVDRDMPVHFSQRFQDLVVRAIADAATSKAAWGIVEWLRQPHNEYAENLPEEFIELLEAAGIQKADYRISSHDNAP